MGSPRVLLAVVVLAAGCGGVETAADSTAAPEPTTTADTVADPTTTVPSTVGSTGDPEIEFTLETVEFSGTSAEVYVPVGEGPFPAAVTVHGGGYRGGTPDAMKPLATLLAQSGFMVFNTRYHLSEPNNPAFPAAIHDVACAVRLAAHHADSDGSVAVIGWSAGAHAGALVTLTGDLYGDDCPDETAVKPSRFVGLGYFDIRHDAAPGPHPFFQQNRGEITEAQWQAGDPLGNVAHADSDLQVLFVHAEADTPDSRVAVEDMIAALEGAGVAADLVVIPGVDHFNLGFSDDTGDTVVEWLAAHQPG